MRVLSHKSNRGKGAAVRTGFNAARGAILAIQDADQEYDPALLPLLREPIEEGKADVVYGTRFGAGSEAVGPRHRRWANRALTWLANQATGLKLTDMETCYKAFRREAIAGLTLRENRFGIEPELTAKIARRGCRVVEVPIRYNPRTYAAGKKVGFRDGLRAVWCIVRYSRWD